MIKEAGTRIHSGGSHMPTDRNWIELEVRLEILQALQEAYERQPAKELGGKAFLDRLAVSDPQDVMQHVIAAIEYLDESGCIIKSLRGYRISTKGTNYLKEYRPKREH
jgi:hypothetical protein